ncbi:hypothetical protein AB4Y40_23310 [Paraburkholderia sp. EG287B]|uniref:hypothetical protein n=1 Tax=Paraburkholderia sp. EG287B TaxID=3237010 RepID=UPI0034D3207A
MRFFDYIFVHGIQNRHRSCRHYVAHLQGRGVPHLLRRSYREDGKVKNETLGNLSHLPESLVEIIRRSLQGETFVPLGQAFEVTGSLAHGHVHAMELAMQRLDFASQPGTKPSLSANGCWRWWAYGPGGVRHRGSVSLIQALTLNCGNLRWRWKAKGTSSKGEADSSDAPPRGGAARSSVEAAVMAAERRG